MDEEQSDIAELEAKLYSQIHHDAPDSLDVLVESITNDVNIVNENKKQQQQPERTVTKNRVLNNTSGGGGSGKHVGYFSSSNATHGGISVSNLQQSSGNRNKKLNPISSNLQTQQKEAPIPNITPNESRPKPFTPYTSYLSQVGLSTSLLNEKIEKPIGNRQFQNPFNRINEKKLNKLIKLKAKQKKARQSKQNLIVARQSQKYNNKGVINLALSSSDEENENFSQKTDDDVVCIPIPPPPLVCIDSSDEEDNSPEQKIDGVDEVLDNPDPLLPEDFIGQRDRRRISERSSDLCDPIGNLDDEELAYICATVENAVQESSTWKSTDDMSSSFSKKSITPTTMANIQPSSKPKESNYVFATPNQTSVKSYEVSDKSFAAVDVYESESSDIPESIYQKGVEKNVCDKSSDSDDSDYRAVEINTVNRSKKMLKRKSSGSNKGSDCGVTDDDDDDDEIDEDDDDEGGEAFVNVITNTSTPHIKKGEAVNNAKTILRKSKKTKILQKKTINVSGQQSDEEFLTMLSCIVHVNKKTDGTTTQEISDDLSGNDNSQYLLEGPDTVLARDIAEHVLNKSTAPIQINENIEINDENVNQEDETMEVCVQNPIEEGKLVDGWVVKDQIGETDDNILSTMNNCVVEEISTPNSKIRKLDSTTEKKITNYDDKKRENFSVQSCSLFDLNDPEIGWNDEMKYFYNKSWGGEAYNQNAILRQMPNKPFEWTISPEDLYTDKNKRRQRSNTNVRCHNCRELGHRYSECYLPTKKINCYMCGVPGHRETRCPNTLCLRCGSKTRVFSKGCVRCNAKNHVVCYTCKANGHMSTDCPDKWRRYHSTISPNEPLKKLPRLQNKRRSCSICANLGHTAENCQSALRIFDMPVPKMQITSYTETYKPINTETFNKEMPTEEVGAPFALFSVPIKNFEFNWNVCENEDRIYGRIMKATNIKRQLTPDEPLTSNGNPVKFVLNPLNVINKQNVALTTKSKKQFTKNFYQEQLIAENDETINTNRNTTDDNHENTSKLLVDFSFTSTFDKMQQQQQKTNQNSFDLGFLIVDNEISSTVSTEKDLHIIKTKMNLIENEKSSDLEICQTEIYSKLNKDDKCSNKTNGDSSSKIQIKKVSTDYHVMLNESEENDESTKMLNPQDHDSDSNYSFSEYFNKINTVSTVTTTKTTEINKNACFEDLTTMPDYIPLSDDSTILNLNNMDDDSSINTDIQLPMTGPAEQSSEISIQSEAKIILTKDHSKFLLTKQGSAFLTEANMKHNVIVRMEWQSIGNILFVKGFPLNQDNFHSELIGFLTGAEEKQKKKQEISQQVPKKRTQLIRFIQEQIIQLDKRLGNVKDIYFKLKLHEKQKSKNGNRRADQTRRLLNMILFGQTGMRDGNMHLAAMQANLRTLIENERQEFISNTFRNEVFQHYRYIFSPFTHNDYQSLVQHYQHLKLKNQLPIVNLDRKLMGLRLDVGKGCITPPPPSPPQFSSVSEPHNDQNLINNNILSEEAKEKIDSTIKLVPPPPSPPATTECINSPKEINTEPNNCEPIELEPSNKSKKSVIWSKNCLEYIGKCLLIPTIANNPLAVDKLRSIHERAVEDKLSYNDYMCFVTIFDKLVNKK